MSNGYKYLCVSKDPKTIKGEKSGFLTGVLYLAPASTSGINVCTNSSAGCRESCLNTAGNPCYLERKLASRIRKTKELFADREAFIADLAKDITRLVRKADENNMTACVRVNGTSDLPWLAHAMAERFPDVRFYDYTKHPKPWKHERDNYKLTFSLSEDNWHHARESLAHGINVAVVFDVVKGKPLPETYKGFKVFDGDQSDLRFLDPAYSIIGLRAKGKAKKDCSGFVKKPALVQIGERIAA